MHLSNWKELILKYKYEDSSPIFDRLRRKGLIPLPEDYDIINMIVLWKLNRTVKVTLETIEYINSIAQITDSPERALSNTDVRDCFAELLRSPGIRLPMASTIFHFYQPKAFPIIDERAYRQIFSEKLNPNSGWDVYSDYIAACIEVCKSYGIPFEQIDKVLYQLDLEKSNKLSGR